MDGDNKILPPAPPPVVVARRQLLKVQRQMILMDLLLAADNWVLPHGALAALAQKFHVHATTVGRLWARALKSHAANPDGSINVDARKHLCGRPKKYPRADLLEAMQTVPFSRCRNERSLAAAIGVPRGTIHRLICKEKIVKRHRSTLKPTLKEDNKLARQMFVLLQVNPQTHNFYDMYDRVHVDEKWFYLTKVNSHYLLAEGEQPPERHVQSKQHITKVMFLCAVARPHGDFDGKLGIWAFAEETPALRNSINRAAGTLVWKNLTVTKDIYRDYMTTKVIPAIKEKWPDNRAFPVYIQQDNCRVHVKPDDPQVVEAGTAKGWNISVYCQPANSPDTNVLDLGFFWAIQSLQYSNPSDTMGKLIGAVEAAYNSYSPAKLNNIFLTMFGCFNEISKCGGGHHYPIPHMDKDQLSRNGILPITLPSVPEAQVWIEDVDWEEEEEAEEEEDGGDGGGDGGGGNGKIGENGENDNFGVGNGVQI